MRIAFVTHQFFPSSSTDVERSTLNLANQLTRMGHEAIVVTPAEHSSGEASSYAYDGAWVRTVAAGDGSDRLAEMSCGRRAPTSSTSCIRCGYRKRSTRPNGSTCPSWRTSPTRDLGDAGRRRCSPARPRSSRPTAATIERYADEGFDTTAWHHIPAGTEVPPSLEEEAWMLEGIYTDCLVNARR